MQVAQYHGVQQQIVVERGNKREGILNLVTTISRYTHINSFEFGGNCMRLRVPHLALRFKFQGYRGFCNLLQVIR
jgi:hypothetical protein